MTTKTAFGFKQYGMTTIGERGQVVIPKEIRKKMNIKPGDQFLVFCRDNSVIGFIKPEKFDTIIETHISKLKSLKNKQ
jgi:AbrB family looped-hinge helix DNA binding protein